MRIPLNDLSRIHDPLRKEFTEAFEAVLDAHQYVRGPQITKFELAFAEMTGIANCIGCCNGTVALNAAFKALGLQPGDEVITTPHTWIATAAAATFLGANVVFADTQIGSYLIDPGSVVGKITEKTKGIIAVHLFGQPTDLNELRAIADDHGLWLVEDCAQAHLATYGDSHVGTTGEIATYSFFPGKNLGAIGDAGAMVTNDVKMANTLRELVDHGGKGRHNRIGTNYRLNSIQAAMLAIKLPYLKMWTEERQSIASIYDARFAEIPDLKKPIVRPDRTHVYHQYVVATPQRDALRKVLSDRGVATGIHYPEVLPATPAYRNLGASPESCPVAFSAQSEILSLPVFPGMRKQEVEYVAESICNFFST